MKPIIRVATPVDFDAVAEMIHVGTNYWYETHGKSRIFTGPVSSARLFPDVYEELDPGCCLLAVDPVSGRPAGSCFYRIRSTHLSLGIMNVHPAYVGQGIARTLLQTIVEIADRESKPLRLVSSAMNLDSFSLYSRAGFVPTMIFQDMILTVPEAGMVSPAPVGVASVRPATRADLDAIVSLEQSVHGIERTKDWKYFIENSAGIWKTFVFVSASGAIDGALASVSHPASNIIGPGIALDEDKMAALLWTQLDARRGTTPLFLLSKAPLVQLAYSWGAKNCELHLAQCRGKWSIPTGVIMPTFMPESA